MASGDGYAPEGVCAYRWRVESEQLCKLWHNARAKRFNNFLAKMSKLGVVDG